MTTNTWFNSLGWWDQKKAFADFVTYREEDTLENFHTAVESAIAVIRVVYSTHKLKAIHQGDEEDLISAAAMTITKALPKMRLKPVEKLDDDKKYMRYLFTCVLNAFYREFDSLYGKMNKIYKKLHDSDFTHGDQQKKIKQVISRLLLEKLPEQLLEEAVDNIRFSGNKKNVCVYILEQRVAGREIAKSIIHLLGCTAKKQFFVYYCNYLLGQSFLTLKEVNMLEDNFSMPDLAEDELVEPEKETTKERTDE